MTPDQREEWKSDVENDKLADSTEPLLECFCGNLRQNLWACECGELYCDACLRPNGKCSECFAEQRERVFAVVGDC